MKNLRRAATASWGFVIAALSFWLYGATRVMTETIGIHWRQALTCAAFTLFAALLISTPAIILHKARWKRAILLTICISLAGSLLSEAIISFDESSFRHETETAMQDRQRQTYCRGRWWPNAGTTLLYARERGYWAYD